MNSRIKELRKALHLSQEAFGERMNLTRNYIYMLEAGQCEISDKIIWNICERFNVNEEWLRTGSGEMLKPLGREEEIGVLVKKIYLEDDPFRQKLIKVIADLTPEQIETLKEIAKTLADEKSLS